MRQLAAWSAALAISAASARADIVDDLGRKAINLEAQALDIERGLQVPLARAQPSDDKAQRRLDEARIAFQNRSYADASLAAYEVVEKYTTSRAYPDALFLLADSLFQKQDNATAREYFSRVITEFGDHGLHYQDSLERLVELSQRLGDPSGVQEVLARLDKVPQGSRSMSAAYVRGKYLYFSGKFEDSITALGAIDRSSLYYFQARYFMGTSYVAKDDLANGAKVFKELVTETPKGADETRVHLLARMALGRIHYERDQLEEALEQYRIIPRRSGLFGDAVYEMAWVYVKAKKFDEALRALEVLALTAPDSARLPEVRILEGNLRVRKAQALTDSEQLGNSAEEYSKAAEAFKQARDSYQKPNDELSAVLQNQPDPDAFLAQLTGKSLETFDVKPLPPMAIKWAKEEPEVDKALSLTSQLGSVQKEITETGDLLARLEKAINSPARIKIFPDLAERKGQVQNLSDELLQVRDQLTSFERTIMAKYASAEDRAALDRAIQKQGGVKKNMSAGGGDESFSERVRKARENVLAIDKKAQEVEVVINILENELSALERYYQDNRDILQVSPGVYQQLQSDVKTGISDLRFEFTTIRRDTAQAMDEAGVSDENTEAERSARETFADAQRSEHEVLRLLLGKMNGDDRAKVEQAETLQTRCAYVDTAIGRANLRIDTILDEQLSDARNTLAAEKTRLDEYRKLAETVQKDSDSTTASVIRDALSEVSKKFYEITVRADLGIVDVTWAQKEEAKDMRDRVSFEASREKRLLTEEYRGIADDSEGAK